MTLAYRLLIAVLAILVGVALLRLSDISAAPPLQCVPKEEHERLRALALEGIDQGFKDQVARLLDVWSRDPKDQPNRAKVGMAQAIAAHIRARKDALMWVPESCKEE